MIRLLLAFMDNWLKADSNSNTLPIRIQVEPNYLRDRLFLSLQLGSKKNPPLKSRET